MSNTNIYIDTENKKNFLINLTVAVTKRDIEDIPVEELEKTIIRSYHYMLDWMIEKSEKNTDLIFSRELKQMKNEDKKTSFNQQSFDKKFEEYYLQFLDFLINR